MISTINLNKYDKLNKIYIDNLYVDVINFDTEHFVLLVRGTLNDRTLKEINLLEYLISSFNTLNLHLKEDFGLETVIGFIPPVNTSIEVVVSIREDNLTYGKLQLILNIFFNFISINFSISYPQEVLDLSLNSMNIDHFTYLPLMSLHSGIAYSMTIVDKTKRHFTFYIGYKGMPFDEKNLNAIFSIIYKLPQRVEYYHKSAVEDRSFIHKDLYSFSIPHENITTYFCVTFVQKTEMINSIIYKALRYNNLT